MVNMPSEYAERHRSLLEELIPSADRAYACWTDE
jgi:hypothetical protein